MGLGARVGFTSALLLPLINTILMRRSGSIESEVIMEALNATLTELGADDLLLAVGLETEQAVGLLDHAALALVGTGFLGRRLAALHLSGAVVVLLLAASAVALHLFTPLGMVVAGDQGRMFLFALITLLTSGTLVGMEARAIGRGRFV